MKKAHLTTPHEILKRSLCNNEEIFIYDEPHRIAVTVDTVHGKKYYTLLLYLPSRHIWTIIDIQNTDEHRAQIMYDCAVYAVNRSHAFTNITDCSMWNNRK